MIHSSKPKTRSSHGQHAGPTGLELAVQRFVRRAVRWLLSFLWRQLVWWLWIGGIALGGYLVAMLTPYTWAGSLMFCLAFLVAVAWFMDLIHYEDEDDYRDGPSRPRESPLEQQRREVEEDIDRYQREQEDRGH